MRLHGNTAGDVGARHASRLAALEEAKAANPPRDEHVQEKIPVLLRGSGAVPHLRMAL